MREITLSPTTHPDGRTEENPPVRVYDTSGPWGDPEFDGNVEEGLPALRRDWILARGDVEEYEGRDTKPEDNGYLSDEHADRYNENKAARNQLKEYPGLKRKPLRANGHPVTPALVRPAGHHHPGDGIHRHPRKPRPRRGIQGDQGWRQGPAQCDDLPAPRRVVRRSHPRFHHPGVRPRRGRPRARHHPSEHQPPGVGTDDHRPEFPRQDQRQHRQLRGRLDHRRRGREDALVDQVGRRHRHGSLDREEHPRHPRVDHPQLPGPDRHRPDLPGARKGQRPHRGPRPGKSTATPSSSRPSRASTTSRSTPASCCASCRSPPRA